MGRRRLTLRTAILVTLSFCVGSHAHAGRHAVLIGISYYTTGPPSNSPFPNLNRKPDVEKIKSVLVSKYHVRYDPDPAKSDIVMLTSHADTTAAIMLVSLSGENVGAHLKRIEPARYNTT